MLSKMQGAAAVQDEIEAVRGIRKKQMRSIRRITNGWHHIDVKDATTRDMVLNAANNPDPSAMIRFEDEAFVLGTLQMKFIDGYRIPRPIDERKDCSCNVPVAAEKAVPLPVPKAKENKKKSSGETLGDSSKSANGKKVPEKGVASPKPSEPKKAEEQVEPQKTGPEVENKEESPVKEEEQVNTPPSVEEQPPTPPVPAKPVKSFADAVKSNKPSPQVAVPQKSVLKVDKKVAAPSTLRTAPQVNSSAGISKSGAPPVTSSVASKKPEPSPGSKESVKTSHTPQKPAESSLESQEQVELSPNKEKRGSSSPAPENRNQPAAGSENKSQSPPDAEKQSPFSTSSLKPTGEINSPAESEKPMDSVSEAENPLKSSPDAEKHTPSSTSSLKSTEEANSSVESEKPIDTVSKTENSLESSPDAKKQSPSSTNSLKPTGETNSTAESEKSMDTISEAENPLKSSPDAEKQAPSSPNSLKLTEEAASPADPNKPIDSASKTENPLKSSPDVEKTEMEYSEPVCMKSPIPDQQAGGRQKTIKVPNGDRYVEIVAKSCQNVDVVNEIVDKIVNNPSTLPASKAAAINTSSNLTEEKYNELRMLDFFDNLQQITALNAAIAKKMEIAFGTGSTGSEYKIKDVAEETKLLEELDDHPFSVIEAIMSFVARLKKNEGQQISMEDIKGMTPDEILYVGCLRNKALLKREELSMVNKIAIAFVEKRINELKDEEMPTDHVRRLYYRFLSHRYNPVLGPILQFLAMSGPRKVRDVEWTFFTVMAGLLEREERVTNTVD